MYFDTHERILQKLAEMGRTEFTAEMVNQAMSKVEEEDLEIQYQEWLKHEEAEAQERAQWRADENTIDRIERSLYEAAQPTSWAQAAEGLEIPQQQPSQDIEMER